MQRRNGPVEPKPISHGRAEAASAVSAPAEAVDDGAEFLHDRLPSALRVVSFGDHRSRLVEQRHKELGQDLRLVRTDDSSGRRSLQRRAETIDDVARFQVAAFPPSQCRRRLEHDAATVRLGTGVEKRHRRSLQPLPSRAGTGALVPRAQGPEPGVVRTTRPALKRWMQELSNAAAAALTTSWRP